MVSFKLSFAYGSFNQFFSRSAISSKSMALAVPRSAKSLEQITKLFFFKVVTRNVPIFTKWTPQLLASIFYKISICKILSAKYIWSVQKFWSKWQQISLLMIGSALHDFSIELFINAEVKILISSPCRRILPRQVAWKISFFLGTFSAFICNHTVMFNTSWVSLISAFGR